MEKVVYLLGAGFSAPLGIPVMNDFLVKSKDLYFGDPGRYKHFLQVFESIAKMSVAKNYFETDLFNIEEILSILDTEAQLRGTRLHNQFMDYIGDVVRAYTPEIHGYGAGLPANWESFIFGREKIWEFYGSFVASLFRITIYDYDKEDGTLDLLWRHSSNAGCEYDVVSLNYDLSLERVPRFLNGTYGGTPPLGFWRSRADESGAEVKSPWLVKLHGSADGKDIVPPVWSKMVTGAIEEQWQVAHQVLSDANHIRVLGYSLPVSDSYVRYLLKSSVIRSQHLKRFDVICLDSDGKTRNRYDGFVKFKYYRFAPAAVEAYLESIAEKLNPARKDKRTHLSFDTLEAAHESFMSKMAR